MGLSVELSLLSSSSEGDFGFKFVPEVQFQLSPISHPNFNSVSGDVDFKFCFVARPAAIGRMTPNLAFKVIFPEFAFAFLF